MGSQTYGLPERLSGLAFVIAGLVLIGFLLDALDKRPGGSQSPFEIVEAEIVRKAPRSDIRTEIFFTVPAEGSGPVECSLIEFSDFDVAAGETFSFERRHGAGCEGRIYKPDGLGGGWVLLILGLFFIASGGLVAIFPSFYGLIARLPYSTHSDTLE